MTLSEKQQDFAVCVGRLLVYVVDELSASTGKRVRFTGGDWMADDGHMPGSCHYVRLAVAVNLFVDGEYIDRYGRARDVWDALGACWEGLDPRARWGGRFGDFNHFSFEHEGRR